MRLISIVAALLICGSLTAQKTVFPERFAPSEGMTVPQERPYRAECCLNGYWNFRRGDSPEGAWEPQRIKIPSPWNVNSFAYRELEGPDHRNYPSYPAEWESVRSAWMQREVTIPTEWQRGRILLHFEAVAGKAQVFVNGVMVAENFDLFLPFEADITEQVRPGETADIRVFVAGQDLFEDPSGVGRRVIPAGSMWGTHIRGIWQDVTLLYVPEIRVEDIYIHPRLSEGRLELCLSLRNDSSRPVRVRLAARVRRWINRAGTTVLDAPVPAWELGEEALRWEGPRLSLNPGCQTETLILPADLIPWTPEDPVLYGLEIGLYQGSQQIDNKYERFGWREWTFRGDALCLNGEPYPLRGDSWHFMGIPQLTRRYAWAWYRAIKDMNGNAVRLHAQVYPRLYLDMADEMGICVLDETANWASDGGPALENPAFWEHSADHLRRLVRRDRNHASVFGWSISNENKPVILYVHQRPDLMPLQEQAWRDWLRIVREEDPSRPWISSDGEEDGEGILPVTVGHYGDAASMRAWKALGKPWGVGEHSMAYYGTPEEVARYNGDRAYESALGRMEGLAHEAYQLLSQMRREGASYSTVFNMAWYALKPLPLGKHELSSAPTLADGIYFAPYVEGIPGVQPERIGPYSTTFNPGYDPSLPLYSTWPLFDAIRSANAPEGPAWSPWAEAPVHQWPARAEEAVQPYESVLCLGPEGGRLQHILEAQGVVLSRRPRGRSLYIVDASIPQSLPAEAAESDIWYWGLLPETAPGYGLDVRLQELHRSSFLPEQRSWTRGMTAADFYFCEVQRQDAARYTLSGPLVEEGEVLLFACRTDWRRWNKRAEELKTAALLRSEYETTEALPVLVKNGRRWISTLDDFLSSEKGYQTLHTLLQQAGVPLQEVNAGQFEYFDDGIYQPGILTRPVN